MARLIAVSIRSSSGWRRLPRARSTSLTPLRQVSITKAMMAASSSGNQPPSNSLTELAAKKMQSISEEEAVDRDHDERRITPLDRHQRRQQRRDGHQQRHGDAVGAGQRVGGAEAAARRPASRPPAASSRAARRSGPSRRWWCGSMCMRGRKPSWIGLLGQRKRAGDDRLRGDDGGQRGEGDQRVVHPIGRELVERIVDAPSDRSAAAPP